MKLLKKTLPIYCLLLMMTIGTAFSQSGWRTSRWYASAGESRTETTYKREWNAYQRCYQSVRYCRQLSWYQEWHAGYIYYWRYNASTGSYQWVSEWQQGNFWHCNWSGWYPC